MSTCPRCELELEVRPATAPGQDESIDVDCCMQCGGLWIDGAELPRASAHLGELFGKRRGYALSSRPSGLACPRCDGALAEIGVNGVPVDWCRVCYGVWLDGGEYQAIGAGTLGVAAPPAPAPRSAPPSTIACVVCACQVSVGDTYFTEEGLVCSGCSEEDIPTSAELARLQDSLRKRGEF
jgi:Zn-finger nucleic acid-binding protein